MNVTKNTPKNNVDESPAASLIRVMDSHQELSAFGFRHYGRRPLDPNQFLENRAAMLSERCIGQFQLACLFLRQIDKIKKLNRSETSYGLKHQVEDWAEANPQGIIPYVANGVFIAAAYHYGFRVEQTRPESPNAVLNFSTRSLKKLCSDSP